MSVNVIQSSVGKYVIPTKNMHTTTIAKEANVVPMYPQGVNVLEGNSVQLRVAA
jgi:hypothetical protein